jgi:hypothetical protein
LRGGATAGVRPNAPSMSLLSNRHLLRKEGAKANSIRACTADGGQWDEEATTNDGSQATASDSPRNRTIPSPDAHGMVSATLDDAPKPESEIPMRVYARLDHDGSIPLCAALLPHGRGP